MKKILMLNYEFPPLGGGAGNATYYLLKEFCGRTDLEVDLITSSVGNFMIEDFAPNVRIHFLDIGKNGNLHFQSTLNLLIYSWKAFFYAKKLITHKKYNLIHAFFGIPCGYIAMKLGLPYVVSLRGSDVPFYNKRFYWLDTIIFKRLSRRIWSNAKSVVTNSAQLKELALETKPKQQIEVIYNGVDTEHFKPNSHISSQEISFISTSRLIKRKGIDNLLKAFTEFYKKHKKGKLYLIGDGNMKNVVEKIIKRKGMQNAIELVGRVNHDELVKWYQNVDIFVLPSLNEGMSNSLLEAMSCGLAVIVTNTGGTRELVDSGNGVLIAKNDTNAIFKAMENLNSNKNLLEQMKKESRKKAEKMSWEEMAEGYFKIY